MSEADQDNFSAGDTPSPVQKRRLEPQSSPAEEPRAKRRKEATTSNNHDMEESDSDEDLFAPDKASTSAADPTLVDHAKQRLSKWAARLFDPNRPRGLVEPPKTIPLNDEFLSAFGKREKEFDKSRGVDMKVDTTIVDSDDEPEANGEGPPATPKSVPADRRKVKISNLSYRTSEETLRQACVRFGMVENVNLLLNKDQTDSAVTLNIGRAYVTFETVDGAMACIDGLKELEGRTLRLSLAADNPISTKRAGAASALARYWETDISTKCFRCGEVGHMESDCKNAPKPVPCSLCAKYDHNMRDCPWSRICFNCGIPGHINRECKYPRGIPKRMVCSLCFQSGHHRLGCKSRPADASDFTAVCMVCYKNGHFSCKTSEFFFGLRGTSCFNCGYHGHLGYDCQRPNLYQCSNEPGLATQEIQRAGATTFQEQLDQVRRDQSMKSRQSDQHRPAGRGRNRSLPPSRRGYQAVESAVARPLSHGRGYR